MSTQYHIPTVIKEKVVAMASAELLTQLQAIDPLIEGINFMYGHYNDIRERLTTMNKTDVNATKRYPLVALFEDYRIRKRQVGTSGITNLKIIILYPTKKDITREQREAATFQPILYPIYYSILKWLKLSGVFMIYDETKIIHDLIPRPHWGDPGLYQNNAYLLNDVLDGLELSNLELTTFLNNCS